MPVVFIEPTPDYPIPADLRDDQTGSFLEEMAVAGNTAEAQVALGAPLPPADPDDLFNVVHNNDKAPLQNRTIATATAEFLRVYSSTLAIDVVAMRTALTNKLVELADCGDPKYELKALEMLGKHSDIGLFTERSEVTINYKNPGELEDAIKQRVQRLLNADIIDITPTPLEPLVYIEEKPAPPPPPPPPPPPKAEPEEISREEAAALKAKLAVAVAKRLKQRERMAREARDA